MKRKATNNIVLHCAATRPSQNVGVADIRKWHKERGWSDIGYHFVIRRDGRVERGRAEDEVGAHVADHNIDSIGICMAGGLNERTWKPENNFTIPQWAALEKLVRSLTIKYPRAKVLGHRDFPGVQKACPCFNARAWAKKLKLPV
jgi:N-acetylmuramoyl-L-alanine amidase